MATADDAITAGIVQASILQAWSARFRGSTVEDRLDSLGLLTAAEMAEIAATTAMKCLREQQGGDE